MGLDGLPFNPMSIFRQVVYANALRHMSLIHIHKGQNPINSITLNVNEEVPVAT